MLGGCAVFCTDHWYCESSGIVIQNKLSMSDVHLIFEKFCEDSTKGCTHCRRRSESADHR